MDFWVILGIIFAGIGGLFLLLLLLVWFFLPAYFRYSYAKNYDGSYEPLEEEILFAGVKTSTDSVQDPIPQLEVNEGKGTYSIKFGKDRSFIEGGLYIAFQGTQYSTSPTDPNHLSLEYLGMQKKRQTTPLGEGDLIQFRWKIPNSSLEIQTSIIQIHEKGLIVFEFNSQSALHSASSETFGKMNLQFPWFKNMSPNQRILAFKDSVFCPPQRNFKITHGPVLLFDDSLNVVLLSSLDKFLTTGWQKDEKLGRIGFGANAQIQEYPAGYSQNAILIFSKGINATTRLWGDLLRQYHRVPKKGRDLDVPTQYLGYYTDNGAHYYYNTEKGKSADETLIQVAEHAKQLGIPYRYYHLDSWWYQKSTSEKKQKYLGRISSLLGGSLYGGTLLWEPDPHYLDIDLKTLSVRLCGPFSTHNRWFEAGSPYVKQFHFRIERGWAMPDDPKFWEHIMAYCQANEIAVYEQDWMSNQMNRFTHLRAELGAAEAWLNNMGKMAEKYGRTIQYCMETPAMVMHSIILPAVTHCRCSDDYHGYAPKNYDIPGFTQASMLADSLGLRPFKDVFKTTKRGRFRGERTPELETLVASLSTGPVGPGDQIGFMNKDLILRTCRSDGRLLKPNLPLTAVDQMYIPHQTYYICSASSQRNNFRWLYALTTNIFPHRVKSTNYSLAILGLSGNYAEYDWHTKHYRYISADDEVDMKLRFEQFTYRIYAPILPNGVAIIGTLEKYATFNDTQFPTINCNVNMTQIGVAGIKNEEILVGLLLPDPNYSIHVEGVRVNQEFQEGLNTVKIQFDQEKTVQISIMRN
jgi:hypothetical protein